MNLSTGFYPFWFWNDYLTAEEIKFQVKEMADKGIKGFFIHPRQGLQQPYMSEAFFEMVDTAIEEAEHYGMLVHLYDEYPYPSGIAGGEITLGNPEYYATALVQDSVIVDGGKIRQELPQGKVLSVQAYPLKDGEVDWDNKLDLRKFVGMVLTEDSYVETGLTTYNRKRYFASKPTPVLETTLSEQKYKIFFSCQVEVDKFKYWNNYVDVLNKNAMTDFINKTHQRYQERYGDKFGKSIISIFTDEIQPGWSPRIPTAFREEYGYDLCDKMPALQDESHPDHTKVAYDLYQLEYKMFCDSFEEPVSSWCQKNGLAYSGEKPARRLAQLKYMDIPGCDPGHIKAGAEMDIVNHRIRGNAKAVASAAYFYDKMGSLCECYHSIGWSGTLQDAKIIAEGLLLLGIDYLVPHGYFYSTHGLKKHDAPPSFFYQMPYWPLFGGLSDRIEQIREQFDGSFIDADVLVVDANSGMPSDDQKEIYEEIQRVLMANHIDFQIADTDILKSGSIEDGKLKVKDLEIELIVIPPMQVIEEPLQKWLAEFEEAGGNLIYVKKELDEDKFVTDVKEKVNPGLSIQHDNQEISKLWIVKRKKEDEIIWFVLNTGGEKYKANIKVNQDNGEGDYSLKEVELINSLPLLTKQEDGSYLREIDPFESFMLRSSVESARSKKVKEGCEIGSVNDLPVIKVPVKDTVDLKLKNKNLLRMYHWQMSISNEKDDYMGSAEVKAVPLSNQLEEGKLPFNPGFEKYFGHEPELKFPEADVCYEYEFDNNYSGQVELVMEPESIVGDWYITVNDSKQITIDDFTKTDAHVRGSLGTDITDMVEAGKNNIKVAIKVNKANDGLLNPLYLAGDFGVSLDPVLLTEQKDKGKFEDYQANLIPYYSGVLEYKKEFNIEELPVSDNVKIEFQFIEHFHQAAEVSINGSDFKPVIWEPRSLVMPQKNLIEGKNEMKVRVYTTLIRSFAGMEFDYGEHMYREI